MEGYLVRELIHYCNITTKKCLRIDEHIIDYYDLTFVLEGSMTYYANGVKYVLQKNDALFLKPRTKRARDCGEDTVRYVSFNFYAYKDAIFSFEEYMPKCITANIRKLVTIYPTSHISPNYYAFESYSMEKCMCMLNYILFELLETATSRYNNEHINKILKYIDENIYENLSLQAISDHVNLSKEYTCAIFKREINKTLTDYINERKLMLARELIISRELALSDVASRLGFNNYNYFCRLFKAYYGMTPMFLKQAVNNKAL